MERCNRTDPPFGAPEKEMLEAFLDWNRAMLLCKIDGLDDEQLRQRHFPSGLTLLGLVKHLSDVERSWFQEVFRGDDLAHLWDPDDPERYWRIEPDDTPKAILRGYQHETDIARSIVAMSELDSLARAPQQGQEGMTLRWIVIHMIEETARHIGHADFMREAIDGQTGE
jgi:uncharacterized damage-inducible protein DinB